MAILNVIYDYAPAMTVSLVAKLLFGPNSYAAGRRPADAMDSGYRRAASRIKLLREVGGYIGYTYAPRAALGLPVTAADLQYSFSRAPMLLYLTPKGLALVAEERGVNVRDLRAPKVAELSPLFLGHELALSRVRAQFEVTVKALPGWELVTWRSTRDIMHAYEAPNPKTGKSERQATFSPDAFMWLRVQGEDLGVFIELDQGTQSLQTRIKDKVLSQYLAYSLTGTFHQRYPGLTKFRVLFVTTRTQERARNLRDFVATLTRKIFWCTTLAQVEAGNPLTDPIWLRVSQDGTWPFWSSAPPGRTGAPER